MGMPRRSLKVLNFSSKPQSPKFSHASAMPSSGQAKLLELMARFDKVMKERPEVAVRILVHAEHVLHMFNA